MAQSHHHFQAEHRSIPSYRFNVVNGELSSYHSIEFQNGRFNDLISIMLVTNSLSSFKEGVRISVLGSEVGSKDSVNEWEKKRQAGSAGVPLIIRLDPPSCSCRFEITRGACRNLSLYCHDTGCTGPSLGPATACAAQGPRALISTPTTPAPVPIGAARTVADPSLLVWWTRIQMGRVLGQVVLARISKIGMERVWRSSAGNVHGAHWVTESIFPNFDTGFRGFQRSTVIQLRGFMLLGNIIVAVPLYTCCIRIPFVPIITRG